jgi:hypothetical protein
VVQIAGGIGFSDSANVAFPRPGKDRSYIFYRVKLGLHQKFTINCVDLAADCLERIKRTARQKSKVNKLSFHNRWRPIPETIKNPQLLITARTGGEGGSQDDYYV